MKNCSQCQIALSEDAQFCPACGSKQSSSTYASYKVKYPLDFGETVRLPFQLRTFFLKALKNHLEAEGKGRSFDELVNRFYDSPFLKHFDATAMDMAEQSYLFHSDSSPDAEWEVDMYLDKQFEILINHFVSEDGIPINNNLTFGGTSPVTENALPQTSRGASSGLVEPARKNLVLETLQLNEEQEKWYTDLATMSKQKLQNALDFFLFTTPDEQIFLICDQTIFGSCREGFALTDRAIYWRAHFNKAQQIHYKDIESLELSKEWLVINGQYFNATPAVNVKMMHLLKKLKGELGH
jgi:hypothetical protein